MDYMDTFGVGKETLDSLIGTDEYELKEYDSTGRYKGIYQVFQDGVVTHYVKRSDQIRGEVAAELPDDPRLEVYKYLWLNGVYHPRTKFRTVGNEGHYFVLAVMPALSVSLFSESPLVSEERKKEVRSWINHYITNCYPNRIPSGDTQAYFNYGYDGNKHYYFDLDVMSRTVD